MRAVVQQVSVTWTKRSRGAPGAVARSAVPEGFPLPDDAAAPSALVVHHVRAAERDGFIPVERVEIPDHGVAAEDLARVELAVVDGALAVARPAARWDRTLAYPRARHQLRKAAFRLTPGTWGRLRANFRHAPEWCGDGWYQQIVVNVAWLPDGPAPAELFTGTPAEFLDEPRRGAIRPSAPGRPTGARRGA